MALQTAVFPPGAPRGPAIWQAGDLFVAESDEALVGYGRFATVPPELHGEAELAALIAAHGGHLFAGDGILTGLAVHPGFRRRGVGTALARARLKHAQQGGAARDGVQCVEGSGSRALYERLGFAVLGRVERYYSDGSGMVLMSVSCSRTSCSTSAGTVSSGS